MFGASSQLHIFDVDVVCQAKRNGESNRVGPAAVGDLRGRWGHQGCELILITTSTFTPGALEVAVEPLAKRVWTIDGEKLVELMMANGVGVSAEPLIVTPIDRASLDEISVTISTVRARSAALVRA